MPCFSSLTQFYQGKMEVNSQKKPKSLKALPLTAFGSRAKLSPSLKLWWNTRASQIYPLGPKLCTCYYLLPEFNFLLKHLIASWWTNPASNICSFFLKTMHLGDRKRMSEFHVEFIRYVTSLKLKKKKRMLSLAVSFVPDKY